MQNYQAYAILAEGKEIAGEQRLWKYEAKADAERLRGTYPTARVVVLDINDQIVYEA